MCIGVSYLWACSRGQGAQGFSNGRGSDCPGGRGRGRYGFEVISMRNMSDASTTLPMEQ